MEAEGHALQHADIEGCSIKASSMHALEEYQSTAQKQFSLPLLQEEFGDIRYRHQSRRLENGR